MATPDFHKLILDSTVGYTAFIDVINYRNVTKYRSKEVLNKNLQNPEIYKLTEGELDLIQQLSGLDRTEAGWFEDKPSWTFAKKFVDKLLVLENGDHAAEFVVDESFGVEAGRIADILNKKMTEAVRVTKKFGGMRAVKRVFKKLRLGICCMCSVANPCDLNYFCICETWSDPTLGSKRIVATEKNIRRI
jgi:hypothetical protein